MELRVSVMEGEFGNYRFLADDGLGIFLYGADREGIVTMSAEDWEACVAEIQNAVDLYRKQERERDGDEE